MKKRIGVTCQVDADGGLGLFSNGVRQTALFLYRMFLKNGHAAVLITGPDAVPTKAMEELEALGIDRNDLVQSAEVDVLIVVSRPLSALEQTIYKSNKTKIILYKGGQNGIGSMEALCRVGGQDSAETYHDATWYDAVWVPAPFGHAYRPWCETIYRCPVFTVPPTWEPMMLDGMDHEFRFKAPEKGAKWNIAVIEPNNTVTRTCHMPIMAIRSALTKSRDIGAIDVLNALQFDHNTHFRAFLDRMAFNEESKVEIHLTPRLPALAFIRENSHVIVTHDWENSLNYLYFEVLYGGWPLVHTSPYLINHGYHYTQWSAGEGGLKIRTAIEGGHDPVAAREHFMVQLMPQLQNYAHHEALL